MEQLKSVKNTLMGIVQGQMGNLQNVDAKELGEAIDMIKDLEEAIYYCTITEAMKEKKDDHYTERRTYMPLDYNYNYRDMDRSNGRMYYDGPSMNGASTSSSSRNYTERELPIELRDYREGRSGRSRRTYMEAKEMHHDKAVHLKELEKYMSELSSDITEMIGNASPEEKQLMEKKMTALASKISATHA